VAWFGKDEKTRDALDRFHKLVDSEERLVIAVTYSAVQNTQKNVDTLLSAADENKQSQKDILDKVEKISTVVTGQSYIPLFLISVLRRLQLITPPRWQGRQPSQAGSVDTSLP
jgi:hypothetical protein